MTKSISSSPGWDNNLNSNNQPYLERVILNSKADKPLTLISRPVELEFGVLVLWREENRRTWRKTLRAGRANNKLNPHVMSGPGIEPGPKQQEANALATASLHSHANDNDNVLFSSY